MNVAISLENIEIPTEFINKTALLFEIKDLSYLHLGIEPSSVALVDNSKEFSTTKPIAFVVENEMFIGLPEKIAEDLYYIEKKAGNEQVLIFSINEISLIGQIKGVFRQNRFKKGFIFKKLWF